MAKKIEIQIVGTGGAQAAAEIKRVGDALGDNTSSKGLAGATKQATKGLQDVVAEAPKVERAGRNMGMATLEASRAFEDMQYGIRGVLNNIPGLVMSLGGTAGIAGAASVAAVAVSILGPKIAQMLGAAEDSKALEEFSEKLQKVRDRAADVAAQRSVTALQAWLTELSAEEEIYTDQNTALERNVQLLRERRSAQASVEDALFEEQVTAIQNDPNKSDAEKARETAAVRNQQETARAERTKEDLATSTQEAARQAAAKQAEFERANQDQLDRVAKVEALEREKVEVQARVKAADEAKKAADIAKGKIATVQSQNQQAASAVAAGFAPPETLAAGRAEEERLRREIEAGENVRVSEPERARAASIDKEIAAAKSAEEQNRTPVDTLRRQAEDAVDQAAKIAEVERIKSGSITQSTEIRNRTRTAAAEAAARTAEAREKAEAEKAAAARQKELDREAAGLGRDAVSLVPKDARGEGRAAVERVRERLKDGDQGGELSELISLLNSLLNSNAVRDASHKADIQALKAKAAQLEGQIKNSRTGR